MPGVWPGMVGGVEAWICLVHKLYTFFLNKTYV